MDMQKLDIEDLAEQLKNIMTEIVKDPEIDSYCWWKTETGGVCHA